jgi:crotonobetainyl-CoA:carnitine CoA-transferase CaiB-like acyl-CoA transferase
VGTEESRAEIGQRVLDGFANLTTAEVVERLRAHGVPVAPVNEIDEVCQDPQIVHNGRVQERCHPVYGDFREVLPATDFSATPAPQASIPALRGEHSEEILGESGRSPDQVRALIEGKIVGTPEHRL